MHGHSIAISGLDVARQGLQIVGNNIANAATEGYHRQEPVVVPLTGDPSARLPIGYGAEITRIRRTADLLLEHQIWAQRPELGQTDQELTTLRTLENLLGNLTAGGLASAIGEFFSAVNELASQPSSPAFRQQVVASAEALAARFRAVGNSLNDLSEHVAREARGTVVEVNELAHRVAEKNNIIQDLQARESCDGALLDQRDQAVSDLAELADVQTRTASDGAYNVYAWGTPVVFQNHPTELEVDYTAAGTLGVSVRGAAHYDPDARGGRLGALLALHNELLPQVKDRVDTLATEIIRRVNQYHVEGVGTDGAFTDLLGEPVGDGPVGEWAVPVTAGEVRVRLTETATGDVTSHTVTIADPSTETLADIAAGFDAVSHLSAAVTDGRLCLTADGGYTFDFRPAVDADPASSTLTGTAAPTLSGVYGGAENQTLTATVVGTGEVGVTPGLALEVRNGVGELVRTVNVGQGYAAGDPLVLADGIDVTVGAGTLNAGETFTVEAVARADPTGFLAAAGVNTFFTGTVSEAMAVADRVRTDAGCLATALGADGQDNLNVLRMAGVGSESIGALGGDRPADAFRSIASEVGNWVAFRESRRDGLRSLLDELIRQRDEVSGVDVNEEAANILILERMFQSMAKYLSAIDRAQQDLMELV